MRKLLKRFLATPMKKTDFMLGIMISRMLFMVPEVLALLVFARYAFGVVNHGSVTAVTLLVLLGATMFSGIGLLGGQPGEDDRGGLGHDESRHGADVDFLGHLLFVGAISRMHAAVHASAAADAADCSLRAVMQEGKSLAELADADRRSCSAWCVVSFALALKWFRWR